MLFFYQPEVTNNQHLIEDEEYMHCVKVLRKKTGDEIGILDGKGHSFQVQITEITKKQCHFKVLEQADIPAKKFYNHIAIAPTKSTDRTEWFVEKACELGVDEISFIHTRNAERVKLRTDRMEKKAISALKQSKSGFLTKINPMVKWPSFIQQAQATTKLIAVVEPDLPYGSSIIPTSQNILVAIGPEGDFDPQETEQALHAGFQKISLGKNTLRTETAGIIAAQMVNIINSY